MEQRGTWGTHFEQFIQDQADLTNHVLCVRIKNRFIAMKDDHPISEKTDYDYIISIDGQTVVFDAKQTHKEVFYFSDHILPKKKIHQYKALLDAHHRKTPAGYFIHFALQQALAFLPIQKVLELQRQGIKGIEPTDVMSQPDWMQIDWNKLFLTI